MRRGLERISVVVAAPLLAIAAAASGWAPAPDSVLTADEAARRVDAHAYYPQAHGLDALLARVSVPAFDSLFAANGARTPSIEFLWRAPDTRRFLVGPSRATTLRAQVVQLLEGRGDLIVPRPLVETLARYETRSAQSRGDTLVLTASTSDTTLDLRALRAVVETGQWRLVRLEARTARGTLVSVNDYQQAEDLNIVSRMNVRYENLLARVWIEHAPVGTLWLASKITYAIRGGSAGESLHRFDIRLDEFRVNQDVPDSAGER